MKKPEIWVSVDIEADGPIPGIYSMLSFGAVDIYDTSRTFYTELKPISNLFIPEALAVSGLDREKLKIDGVDPKIAMESFEEWLLSLGGRPVFCSFSSWDWVFVYRYLIRYLGRSPFGHSSLDIKSYYAGRYGCDWSGTAKKSIGRDQPWILKGLGRHTHHALDDAKEQGAILYRIRQGEADPFYRV